MVCGEQILECLSQRNKAFLWSGDKEQIFLYICDVSSQEAFHWEVNENLAQEFWLLQNSSCFCAFFASVDVCDDHKR